jgi:sugar lactone lactonase YvrE
MRNLRNFALDSTTNELTPKPKTFQRMNSFYRTRISFLFVAGLVLYSCSKSSSSGTTTTPTIPPAPPPVISTISPDSGVLGTTVTISGTGFSANATDNLVKFNDSNAVVTSATATQLTVKVPVSAGTGPVTVTVGGKKGTGPAFNYLYTITVSTLAGNGNMGFVDGNGTTSEFNWPSGICADSLGNIYVADWYNNRIRKITPSGLVSTFAGSTQGSADGDAATAKFKNPAAICMDGQGNFFVTDEGNHRIRKITPSGVVSTVAGSSQGFADGNGQAAQFNSPIGICIDGKGNLYVGDYLNYKIRKITSAGYVSTVAGSTKGTGDGTGTSAHFGEISGICLDNEGNILVADHGNNNIRKITPAGVVTTLAGNGNLGFADGDGSTAQFNGLTDICGDGKGSFYVADFGNGKIRKVTASGFVSTFAGGSNGYADGDRVTAQFNEPDGICIDFKGNIYVADAINNRIRKIVVQ